MSASEQALVSAVEVKGLFGNKDLRLDFSASDAGERTGRRLSLLYGNNGSGKTTALKLLWHALSPSRGMSHRSYISRTIFSSFNIYLCTGDVIEFDNAEEDGGTLTATVRRGGEKLLEQAYHKSPDGEVIPIPRLTTLDEGVQQSSLFGEDDFSFEEHVSTVLEERYRRRVMRHDRNFSRHFVGEFPDAYVEYLQQIGTGPYMLADDRKIYGDDIETKRRIRGSRKVGVEEPSVATQGVAAELQTALRRVNEMVQRLVISGNVTGSQGSNNVYLNILEKVAQTDLTEGGSTAREGLIETLNSISAKTAEYSVYGMMPRIDRESFVNVIQRTPDSKMSVAEDVMQPFLEAHEARLDALGSVTSLLNTFIGEVNRFFGGSGKTIQFVMQHGFQVFSDDGQQLQPDDLSSGERQILLLLLNTVLARENTRLFLIDEPELSLNVKWQRQLMSALLALTEDSPVQFIVATHSIEVITGHSESLTRVAPRVTRSR